MLLNEIHAAVFVRPCVLSDRPPVFWWLSPGYGGVPLHDAVGINFENGATSEHQGGLFLIFILSTEHEFQLAVCGMFTNETSTRTIFC